MTHWKKIGIWLFCSFRITFDAVKMGKHIIMIGFSRALKGSFGMFVVSTSEEVQTKVMMKPVAITVVESLMAARANQLIKRMSADG